MRQISSAAARLIFDRGNTRARKSGAERYPWMFELVICNPACLRQVPEEKSEASQRERESRTQIYWVKICIFFLQKNNYRVSTGSDRGLNFFVTPPGPKLRCSGLSGGGGH